MRRHANTLYQAQSCQLRKTSQPSKVSETEEGQGLVLPGQESLVCGRFQVVLTSSGTLARQIKPQATETGWKSPRPNKSGMEEETLLSPKVDMSVPLGLWARHTSGGGGSTGHLSLWSTTLPSVNGDNSVETGCRGNQQLRSWREGGGGAGGRNPSWLYYMEKHLIWHVWEVSWRSTKNEVCQ